MANVVGSTSQLINAARTLDNEQFIVATDTGIFYKMQQVTPGKTLIAAPTAGEGAACRSCAHCPWMAMNELESVLQLLEQKDQKSFEIQVDAELREKALLPLKRMLDFSENNKLAVKGNA